jgi:hypothetical protein
MGARPMRLPDFLVIGAMKSGTSSLHRYLGQHPDVFTSKRKELNYFWHHPGRGQPIERYASHFAHAGDAKVAGESSPNYMKEHMRPGTAARIAGTLPKARLICLLRDPIDRLVSHYAHNVWMGRESRPFADAVLDPNEGFLMSSRYGWQLSHYIARFPRSQLLVMNMEDINRPEGIRRVLEYLDVDPTFRIDTSGRYFKKGDPLPDGGGLDDNGKVVPSMRDRLAALLRDDIVQLRSQLGSDLSYWDLA